MKLSPSSVSRDIVHVEFRDKISILPDLSASNRSAVEIGTNATLPASAKIPAATARQKSTSKPDHLPPPSSTEKPRSPSFTPQISFPRCFTISNVDAAADVIRPDKTSDKKT